MIIRHLAHLLPCLDPKMQTENKKNFDDDSPCGQLNHRIAGTGSMRMERRRLEAAAGDFLKLEIWSSETDQR
jgi:hypothetical protein